MQRMKSCNSEFHSLTVNTGHLSADMRDMDFAQHIFYIPPKIVEAICFFITHSFYRFYKYLYHCRTISLTDEKIERFYSHGHVSMQICWNKRTCLNKKGVQLQED